MDLSGKSVDSMIRQIPGRLISMGESPRTRYAFGWLVLVTGLVIWTAVQSVLAVLPLWERALPPEPDDTFTYVLKTVQMEECFYQDCPALEDLRKQFGTPTSDQEVASQRSLASSRVYPVYHPLFSAFLLGLTHFGPDPMQAYKIVWTVGPIFFGIAFAYLLSVLFGQGVAGIALILLACKVFPDTGLTYVVPSNLCMALAVIVWARIIARQGDAPWTLVIGSLVLVGTHTVGRIYSVIAAVTAMAIARGPGNVRTWLPVALSLVIVAATFVMSSVIARPSFVNIAFFPSGPSAFGTAIVGALESMVQEITEIFRLEQGLFGSIPIFCGALVYGYFTLPGELRRASLRFIVTYIFFIAAIHLYASSHPADVILRIWIPLVVTAYGLVAHGIWYTLKRTFMVLAERFGGATQGQAIDLRIGWPVVALAVLFGYSFSMFCNGAEQVLATSHYVRDREPLSFSTEQPRLLLDQAAPGDKVLYTSMIAMPYFFIYGTMRLGAVYYHPAMANEPGENALLNDPRLKFAVTYNPTVYHPSFEGVRETSWWISSPSFRVTPFPASKRELPISYEGMIRAARFRWIEVASKNGSLPADFRVLIKNPGPVSTITFVPLNSDGQPLLGHGTTEVIPQSWFGWVRPGVDLPAGTQRIKLIIPDGDPVFSIGGMVFGDSKLHWPWDQKADLSVEPRDHRDVPITVSFDYTRILPEALHASEITVLDDRGSSVLFRIDRPSD